MDAWQMGGLLRPRAIWEGQSQERHLARDIWHSAGRPGSAPETGTRTGLGGEVLAKHAERERSLIPQSSTVLFNGRRLCLDSESSSLLHIV